MFVRSEVTVCGWRKVRIQELANFAVLRVNMQSLLQLILYVDFLGIQLTKR